MGENLAESSLFNHEIEFPALFIDRPVQFWLKLCPKIPFAGFAIAVMLAA
jgi:hypothetical protein